MAAKRKIAFKKKETIESIDNEVVETPVVEEETVGTTVVENEINDIIEAELNNVKEEEKKVSKKSEKVIWTVGDTVVTKPKGQIAFEAQVAPVPMFKIPADIRQYLMNNGFTTDVYKKDKEWLDAHNVDMEMIDRLKDFLTRL